MATFSETYFHQNYIDALSNSKNIEELVSLFKDAKTIFRRSLLTKLEILTHEEFGEFEESSRGGLSERREKQSRYLIEKVRCKNSLEAYRGFRVFTKREAEKCGQIDVFNKIFPFGADEDKAGLARAIRPNGIKGMMFSKEASM